MTIWVTYVSAGSGHKKAAEAIVRGFDQTGRRNGVELRDALSDAVWPFWWLYPQIYLFLVHYTPWLWGFCYYVSDIPWLYRSVLRWVRRGVNAMGAWGFARRLEREQPDVVVSTHFLASEMTAALKRQRKIRSQLITVVTDYGIHSLWVVPGTDWYVVGSDEAKEELVRRGVERERIYVLGIPIDPAFAAPHDRAAIRRQIGLQDERPTLLAVSGGFGVGPMRRIIDRLDVKRLGAQMVVVCGRNPRLVEHAQRVAASRNGLMRIFGFVDNMDELMAASDVIITKSGGLTVSAALALSLPLVIFTPIPGQEARNAAFLIKYGAAVQIDRFGRLEEAVRQLLAQPGALRAMQQRVRRLAKPGAAVAVARLTHRLMRQAS
jgi:processive 1,2-diacylglycerol beta-glucosyltransferase